jgi:TetR/AcrR family transcriptional regulator, transcriptional repressor for nem operon
MARSTKDKRTRLLAAATDLSHERGLGKVALADIAERSDVPLGNIYYYFKTKDAIGEAVIGQRRSQFRQLRQAWEQLPTPQERLKALVSMTVDNRKSLARSGCPVGSLCAELGKVEGALAAAAAVPLRELLAWIEAQFAELGQRREKHGLAVHLLSALQGVSLLANCFRDANLVSREAEQLNAWIDTLVP